MSSTVIPFPRTHAKDLSAATADCRRAILIELDALERFVATTDQALAELRTTERLIDRAAEALASGDIDQMLPIRDALAARIEERRAARERRRAARRSATR